MDKCPRCNIEWSKTHARSERTTDHYCDCGLILRWHNDSSNKFYYYDDHSELHFHYPTTWYGNGKCIISIYIKDRHPTDDGEYLQLSKWISFNLDKAKEEIEKYLLLK